MVFSARSQEFSFGLLRILDYKGGLTCRGKRASKPAMEINDPIHTDLSRGWLSFRLEQCFAGTVVSLPQAEAQGRLGGVIWDV